jgi:hypothetical protein
VFDKLLGIATELNINSTNKQNQKVEKLFNDNVLFEKIEKCEFELNSCKKEIDEIRRDKINIDEEQLKRVKKLQAIGILDDSLSDALKSLIDSYLDVEADKIKESVLKI